MGYNQHEMKLEVEYVEFWSRTIALHLVLDSYARATSRRVPIVVITPIECDNNDIQL